MTSSTITRTRRVAQETPSHEWSWASIFTGERLLMLALVLVGLVAHGFNMFNYPALTFNGDEGIYTGQALAVLREGRLSFYTYWYDHAPGGWILLASWLALTGDLHLFGGVIENARVFMLLLHLAQVLLVYGIARKLRCSMAAAAAAALLFSLSPLAIFYQRMVLLDNFMTFWLLLSLDLAMDGRGRLSRMIASGVAFGMAMLAKETAVVLLPAMLFIIFRERREHHGRFAVVGWLLPLAMVVSWYPLYALLKGEFLPYALTSKIWSDQRPHVSLLETLAWQMSRGGGGMFSLENQFWQQVRYDWAARGVVVLFGGTLAVLVNFVRGIRSWTLFAVALLGALPLLYFARGGIVFSFYILFALPFLCLNIGVLLNVVFARLPTRPALATVAVLAVALSVGHWTMGLAKPLYTEQPSQSGRDVISWIRAALPADSAIIADDAFLPDLRVPPDGAAAFPNVHSHWKVGSDEEVWQGIFNDDWRNIDYLIMTPNLESAFISQHQHKLALQALQHAHFVKQWNADGAIIEIWKVDKVDQTEAKLLSNSAQYLDTRFERDGAYVAADGMVRAESQAYALLRAVWSDDEATFRQVWQWTQRHLINANGLPGMAWRDRSFVTAQSTADASTDMALALLMAGRQWNDLALREDGTRMVQAIWQHEVTTINGEPYISAGDWAVTDKLIAVNPSYLAPYAYRTFQTVDHTHDWTGVVATSYRVLDQTATAQLGTPATVGLPPNWIGLDPATGAIVPFPAGSAETSMYGADAARTYWRIALDWRWSGDARAKEYLATAAFLRDELDRIGVLGAAYARDGKLMDSNPSAVSTAGALAALDVIEPAAAGRVYAHDVVGGATYDGATIFWGDKDDLATQEWNWFATAFYADALPNVR